MKPQAVPLHQWKIVLTKKTKDSFKLFNDVFQFFYLAGYNSDDNMNDAKNLDKYN
jgi:hypothetical protein